MELTKLEIKPLMTLLAVGYSKRHALPYDKTCKS